ncbi:hypothetical protein LTR62_001403 [Meristemomyces frigidus]|uniref:N-acetylglucosamine-induced protein 1 n=1 Tax=Meristemomyces frigidus TaxID=1508187 RepID=A0AAN7TB16_9PEZI|nr:hypothetical protein LTR62_001403 [Meristemomyces frigidus]
MASPTINSEATPFWNTNIPPAQHTNTCPDYLSYAVENKKDREILSTLDNDYTLQTWPQVRDIVATNRIDLFQRVPSDLRRYRQFTHSLKAKHGSIMEYVLCERLKWDDHDDEEGRRASGKGLFAEQSDWKFLQNDWPYGLDKRIVHLVCWTKFTIPEDEETADLSSETRRVIDGFVERTFVKSARGFGEAGDEGLAKENVIWFRNWRGLKSIRAVEHIHVLLFEPEEAFVERVTGGDVPTWVRIRDGELKV